MDQEQLNDFVANEMHKNILAICTLIENGITTMNIEFEHNGKKFVWHFASKDEVMILEVEK